MTETKAEHCWPQIVFQVNAPVQTVSCQVNSVAHTSRRRRGTKAVINAVGFSSHAEPKERQFPTKYIVDISALVEVDVERAMNKKDIIK